MEPKVNWEHGKAAIAVVQGIAPKMLLGTESGVNLGDASFYGAMDSMLYVLRNDKLVSFEFGLAQFTREQRNALADKVLSRL